MPDETDAQLDQQAAGAQAQQEEFLSQGAPEPQETLQGNRLTALSEALAKAAEALSDGQLEVEGETFEDQEAVPPSLFAQLTALSAIAAQVPEAEQYQFDPTEVVTTNAGLAEGLSNIGKMGRDKKLAKAVAKMGAEAPPAEEAPPPAAEEAPTDDDFLA